MAADTKIVGTPDSCRNLRACVRGVAKPLQILSDDTEPQRPDIGLGASTDSQIMLGTQAHLAIVDFVRGWMCRIKDVPIWLYRHKTGDVKIIEGAL